MVTFIPIINVAMMMKSVLDFYSIVLSVLFIVLLGDIADACVGLGSVSDNPDGNVILVKSRDAVPAHQMVQLVKNRDGNSFIGLFAWRKSIKHRHIKAGVNDKGLSIISLSSDGKSKKSIAAIKKFKGFKNVAQLMNTVLLKYSSIDEIERDQQMLFKYTTPMFYMIADKKRILVVEIGVDRGRSYYVIKNISKGFVAHTNHYILSDDKKKSGDDNKGSRCRLTNLQDSIGALGALNQTKADFDNIVSDTQNHQGCRIFRYSGKNRTVATWTVMIPKNGKYPILDVSLYTRIFQREGKIMTDKVRKKIVLTPEVFGKFTTIYGPITQYHIEKGVINS